MFFLFENEKVEEDKIEIEDDKIEDIDVTSILSQINPSRKEELMKFLLSNSKSEEEQKSV